MTGPSRRERAERAERDGRRGEHIAAWWLRLKGWRIVAVRRRTRWGEVDLIARRWRTLAFIEVKWRARDADRDTAIDQRRLARVAAAARDLAPRLSRPDDRTRIDVVLLAPRRWPRHLPDAWRD